MRERIIGTFPVVDAHLYAPKGDAAHALNRRAVPCCSRTFVIEIREDLIVKERGQDEWAERLPASLTQADAH